MALAGMWMRGRLAAHSLIHEYGFERVVTPKRLTA